MRSSVAALEVEVQILEKEMTEDALKLLAEEGVELHVEALTPLVEQGEEDHVEGTAEPIQNIRKQVSRYLAVPAEIQNAQGACPLAA